MSQEQEHEKEKVAIVCENYTLTMTGAKIGTITSTDTDIVVSGTADFKLKGNLLSGQNWLIPNFKAPVTGCLTVSDDQIVELESDVSLEEVTKQVFDYITAHPGARTSDLIIELSLDPDLIVEALDKLSNGDRIEGKDVKAKQE